MLKTERDKIDEIVKTTFKSSFDQLDVYHQQTTTEGNEDPILIIDGTKAGKTFTFKYAYEELAGQQTDGILKRELVKARDRALKQTYS